MQATFDEIREYVLNVTANDYESLDRVVAEVNDWASKDGKELSAPEIIGALFSLVNDGLIDCFVYRPEQSAYKRFPLNEERASDYWYYISEQGKCSL